MRGTQDRFEKALQSVRQWPRSAALADPVGQYIRTGDRAVLDRLPRWMGASWEWHDERATPA